MVKLQLTMNRLDGNEALRDAAATASIREIWPE